MKNIDFRQGGHKLLHHLDRVLPWTRGERVCPVHMEIGTGPICNFRCLFCFTEFQKAQPLSMDREVLLKVMRDAAAAGVRSVGILGDGEPTLHPALAEAVELGHSLGLDIGLATNGLRFTPELAQRILPHLVWVRFTTCAATPETFSAIHGVPPAARDTVMDNIRAATSIRDTMGLDVTIGMQMIMVPENIHEAPQLARLAGELGADYFVAKQASLTDSNEYGFDLGLYDAHQDLLEAVEAESRDGFSAMVAWRKIMSKGSKGYGRCMGWAFLMQVTGSGHVYPCSALVGRREFMLGDLSRETLVDILAGERYAEVARAMDALDLETCATCCRHDAINGFLWELSTPPDHVNFI